jgi:hypothetical protein
MEGSTPGFSELGLKEGRSLSRVLPDALDVLWRPTKNFDRFRDGAGIACNCVLGGPLTIQESQQFGARYEQLTAERTTGSKLSTLNKPIDAKIIDA